MFGGIGFFKDGLMFGMIGRGVLRLKIDETNQADYDAAGMQPMFPKMGSPVCLIERFLPT
jgi:DNA transformation protein